MLTVNASQLLIAGLKANFWDTWKIKYDGIKQYLGNVMELDIPSDTLQEIFGFFETAGYPKRWPLGQTIGSEPFKGIRFTAENVRWGFRIPWSLFDERFEKTGSLETMARDGGEHWATLPERVFFQMIQNITDPDLLQVVPNAPDGAQIYSATDGAGADRFGVVGGNIIATALTAGVGSGGAVRSDFYRAITRIQRFLNPRSQPIFDESVFNAGITIFYNVANRQPFAEAFKQSQTQVIVQNVAGSENVAVSTVTNIVTEEGLKVKAIGTPRITNNKWYGFVNGLRIKPIFKLLAEPMIESIGDRATSDHTRDTGEKYIQWESIEGYGANTVYGTFKVDAA